MEFIALIGLGLLSEIQAVAIGPEVPAGDPVFPPRSALAYLGVPVDLFHLDGVEYFGRLNLLNAGLLYADAISTVSPRYSEEIRTPAFGEGLDGGLRERAASLTGILNGVDYEAWNPETDPRLAAPYSAADPAGKARCKEALDRELGFEPDPGMPLFGTISRMADQKGFDLLADEATRQSGFYDKDPGAELAVKQLTNKLPTENSKGLRFGNFVQGREVIEEEMESVFSGKKDAKTALDDAVRRGNEILRRFQPANK